jgi:hypothetical protein
MVSTGAVLDTWPAVKAVLRRPAAAGQLEM